MLEAIGRETWMDRRVAAADAFLGRVSRVDRGLVSVLAEDGARRAGLGGALLARLAADPLDGPCTGDWCVLRAWPDGRSTVEEVLPRRTALLRATAGEQSRGQLLCANMDLVGLVVALEPLPVLARVERLVALAWESGARPLMLLSKADLVADADDLAEDVAAAAPGVDVLALSTVSGRGLDAVRQRIAGERTLALVGASGHGKSSLVNALAGAEVLGTRAIRDDGRGRHTSVRRELVPLPGGGAVIDTPGLRGVGLVDADAGVARTFADVEGLAEHCRFHDCAHTGEPGCAVAEALAAGLLSHRRFESWQRLQRELSWMAARRDARLRAEQTRERRRRARQSRRPRR